MSWLKRFLGSTIGRKVLVGITGAGLVLFLVGHLSGNLQIFYADEGAAFNAYAEWLHGLAILPLIEAGLALFFVAHIVLTIQLTRENRAKRAGAYKARGTKADTGPSLMASRTMAVSGVIVLVFLVVHVADFRLQHSTTEDMHALVIQELQVGWRMGLYTVASLLVGWHMFHGIQSVFRTLGFHNPKLTPIVNAAGRGLALLLALGFAAMPVWAFFIR